MKEWWTCASKSMNLSKVESDIDRRKPEFIVPEIEPGSDEIYPIAHIWCGLDNEGNIGMIVPVLFHREVNDISESLEAYRQFSLHEEYEQHLNPVVYSDTFSSSEIHSVEMTYRIKPINEGNVETEINSDEDVRDAANVWRDEFAEKSLNYRRRPAGHNGCFLRLRFRVYSTGFRTQLPIFYDHPGEDELQSALSDVRIPCATIVPNDLDAEPLPEKMETKVKIGSAINLQNE